MNLQKYRSTLCLTLCMLCLAFSVAQAQSKDATAVYAIRNARIVTVSGPVIEKGTVVIQNGKIAAVGENVSVPGNAKVIDAAGMSVYPGLIDSSTILGLTEVGAVNATVDSSEIGDFNANMKALTAVNPHSELIPVARSNGVTSVLTCPQGGIVAGQCALINTDGWSPQEMAVKASAAMHINYPVAGFRGGGGFGGGSFGPPNEAARQQRDKRVEELKKKLEDAQAYFRAKEAAAADKNIPARLPDLAMEAMIPVIKGEVPVLVDASGEKEIRGAIEIADKFKLRLIIGGGEEAFKVASVLKEKNIPVILYGVLDMPDSEDAAYDQPFARAGELHKAGVRVAISTGDASNVRLLPYHAGTAAAFGLPREEALKAVTLYPAQIFGVDKMIGSIEQGKTANLIITDGDPLEFKTRLKHMFINGHQVDLTNKHIRLYEKFKDRP